MASKVGVSALEHSWRQMSARLHCSFTGTLTWSLNRRACEYNRLRASITGWEDNRRRVKGVVHVGQGRVGAVWAQPALAGLSSLWTCLVGLPRFLANMN